MSLDESQDGVREITVIQFFQPGQVSDSTLDFRPEMVEEEPKEKADPKGSSVPESASSSVKQDDLVLTQTEVPSPSVLAPPAPPTPTATADKVSGPPRVSESSTPTG